jgi:NitT/TauT family transport system permease protein
MSVTSPPPEFDPEQEVRQIRSEVTRRAKRERVLQLVLRLGFVVGFFLFWHWYAGRTSALVLPAPLKVLRRMSERWDYIVGESWITLQEGFFGAIIGGVIGFGFGIVIAHSARAQAVFSPFIVASQAVPKVALAPLFVIWLGFGMEPKIAVAALISFFPLLENTIVGLRRVDPLYVKLFRSAGASQWKTFWRLRLINASPFILTGARVSLLYALLGAVVGEFIAGNRGLGAGIVGAQGNFDTELMYGLIIALTVLGVGLYALTLIGERLILKRLRLSAGAITDKGAM